MCDDVIDLNCCAAALPADDRHLVELGFQIVCQRLQESGDLATSTIDRMNTMPARAA